MSGGARIPAPAPLLGLALPDLLLLQLVLRRQSFSDLSSHEALAVARTLSAIDRTLSTAGEEVSE